MQYVLIAWYPDGTIDVVIDGDVTTFEPRPAAGDDKTPGDDPGAS